MAEEPDSYCIAICPSGLPELQGRCELIPGHDGNHRRTYIENDGKPDRKEWITWWD